MNWELKYQEIETIRKENQVELDRELKYQVEIDNQEMRIGNKKMETKVQNKESVRN